MGSRGAPAFRVTGPRMDVRRSGGQGSLRRPARGKQSWGQNWGERSLCGRWQAHPNLPWNCSTKTPFAGWSLESCPLSFTWWHLSLNVRRVSSCLSARVRTKDANGMRPSASASHSVLCPRRPVKCDFLAVRGGRRAGVTHGAPYVTRHESEGLE